GGGVGIGEVTAARYNIALDNTTVIRTRPGESRIKVFNREQGFPQQISGTCSPLNIRACASRFVVTTRSETRNGVRTKPDAQPDEHCSNRDGSPRGQNED